MINGGNGLYIYKMVIGIMTTLLIAGVIFQIKDTFKTGSYITRAEAVEIVSSQAPYLQDRKMLIMSIDTITAKIEKLEENIDWIKRNLKNGI